MAFPMPNMDGYDQVIFVAGRVTVPRFRHLFDLINSWSNAVVEYEHGEVIVLGDSWTPGQINLFPEIFGDNGGGGGGNNGGLLIVEVNEDEGDDVMNVNEQAEFHVVLVDDDDDDALPAEPGNFNDPPQPPNPNPNINPHHPNGNPPPPNPNQNFNLHHPNGNGGY